MGQGVDMSGGCPTDERLDRLLGSLLSAADERDLEQHVAGCDECQQRLERLTSFSRTVHPLPVGGTAESKGALRSIGLLARISDSSQPMLGLIRPVGERSRRGGESCGRYARGVSRALAGVLSAPQRANLNAGYVRCRGAGSGPVRSYARCSHVWRTRIPTRS